MEITEHTVAYKTRLKTCLAAMPYRFAIFVLCLLALGAGQKLCPVHNAPMTRKLVPVIVIMDRHRVEEWQAYTNARARLFPYSCDELCTNAEDVFKTSDNLDSVPTNVWIYVCPKCEERKRQWQADHPPRKAEPGEVP